MCTMNTKHHFNSLMDKLHLVSRWWMDEIETSIELNELLNGIFLLKHEQKLT